MKKIIQLFQALLIVFSIIACQKIEDLTEEISVKSVTEGTNSVFSYIVSIETAKYFAKLIRKEEYKSIKSIISPDKDTLIYIINYERGWLLLSADKRVEPILASSEVGHFSTTDDNPGVAHWFNMTANNIAGLKNFEGKYQTLPKEVKENVEFWMKLERASKMKNFSKSAVTKNNPKTKSGAVYYGRRTLGFAPHSTVVTQDIGPLLTTKWGQWSPWNSNMPYGLNPSNNNWNKCPTGCVSVAVSQILYYFHNKINHPNGLFHLVVSSGLIHNAQNYTLHFERDNYVANSTRWNQMPLNRVSPYNSSYVADLMADIGNRVNMEYSYNGSGAYFSTNNFYGWGINSQMDNYSYYVVRQEIMNEMPVYASACAGTGTTGWWFWQQTYYDDCHAWVIDGLKEYYNNFIYYYFWEMVDEFGVPMEQFSPDHPDYEPNPQYDFIITEAQASALGVYHYMYDEEIFSLYQSGLKMNWGWNSDYFDYDDAIYGTSASWSAGGHHFQYIPRIIYNYSII